jgi:hypothetical protein
MQYKVSLQSLLTTNKHNNRATTQLPSTINHKLETQNQPSTECTLQKVTSADCGCSSTNYFHDPNCPHYGDAAYKEDMTQCANYVESDDDIQHRSNLGGGKTGYCLGCPQLPQNRNRSMIKGGPRVEKVVENLKNWKPDSHRWGKDLWESNWEVWIETSYFTASSTNK